MMFMILAITFIYNILQVDAAAAKPGRGRRKKAIGVQFGAFLAVIKYTILLSLLPILIYFAYSVLTDPDLPRVMKYLWNAGKKRWLSYLGKPQLSVEPDLTEDDTEFMRDPFGLYENHMDSRKNR